MGSSEIFLSLTAGFRGPQNRLTNFVSRLTKFVSRLTNLKVCSRRSFWNGMRLRTGSRGGTKSTYKLCKSTYKVCGSAYGPKSVPGGLILESFGVALGALLAYESAFGNLS